MTIDQYDLCPCGSGKKIKFCCSKDLVHDLDRLMRMVEGEQILAAREKVEQLLEKHPDRPSLLMIKCDVDLNDKHYDAARKTLNRLVELQPKNPSVMATQALLQLMLDRDVQGAIHQVQNVFESLDTPVTRRLYEALLVICPTLVALRQPLAAKGHMQLVLALSDAKDERVAQSLMQFNQNREISLLMREPLSLEACPENVTWRIEFEAAMNEIHRGRWRKGARLLEAMSQRILDAPAILFNQAVVYAWLAENEAAARAWRAFSQIRDVPQERRVHALALAMEIENRPGRVTEVVQFGVELSEFDRTLERCQTHPRLVSLPVDEAVRAPQGAPLPRAVFQVLDRPAVREPRPALDELPEILGMMMVFGRETDRPPRLVVEGAHFRRGGLLDLARELGEVPEAIPTPDELVSRHPWWQKRVLGDWKVVRDGTYDATMQYLRERYAKSISERWAHTPSPYLDGRAPAEAVHDGKQTFAVMASLLAFRCAVDGQDLTVDEGAQRAALNLPPYPPLDLEKTSIEELPIHQYEQLDIETLTDEQLLAVYRRAYALMSVAALRTAALEVVSRESLNDRIDKVEAYDILSDVARTSDDSLKYLEQARRLATKDGESPAAWLVDEANWRLIRGEYRKFAALFKEIQERYAKEPGVIPALIEVLARHGLVTADGRVMMPMPEDGGGLGGGASESGGKLWTPDADVPPTGEVQSESKLWIPGAD